MLMKQFGEAARATVKERFDLKMMVHYNEEIYSSFMNANKMVA